MYFRRYYHNCECRQNKPSVCQTKQIIPEQTYAASLKTSSAGGIILTGTTNTEKEYDLLTLVTHCPFQSGAVAALNFACNITLINAKADIRFQLLKSGDSRPVLAASPAVYRRVKPFSGSDTIFFTIHDPSPVLNGFYLIRMNFTGILEENSMAAITNPVLTAVITGLIKK